MEESRSDPFPRPPPPKQKKGLYLMEAPNGEGMREEGGQGQNPPTLLLSLGNVTFQEEGSSKSIISFRNQQKEGKLIQMM